MASILGFRMTVYLPALWKVNLGLCACTKYSWGHDRWSGLKLFLVCACFFKCNLLLRDRRHLVYAGTCGQSFARALRFVLPRGICPGNNLFLLRSYHAHKLPIYFRSFTHNLLCVSVMFPKVTPRKSYMCCSPPYPWSGASAVCPTLVWIPAFTHTHVYIIYIYQTSKKPYTFVDEQCFYK